MATETKRSTIYLDQDLHRAARMKAVNTNRSISDVVNDSLRLALQEDADDLAAFDERANEPTMSYESLLKKLKADGKI